jgi:short chain dehydrogenase
MAKRHGRKRFYIVGEGVFGERNEGDVDGKLLIRAAAADAAAGAPGAVFLDQLRDGGGDLVNISSVAGRTARAGNASYAATKWASTAGPKHCARNSNPTSASSSSSPEPWRPSW